MSSTLVLPVFNITYDVLLCLASFTPGFPCGSAGKKSTCNAGDLGSIPGLGRSLGEGKGYPLQHSSLENPMDYTVCGVTKSQTRLSDSYFHFLSPHVLSERFSLGVHAAAAAAKSLQSCPTLCDPMDGSPPGSPIPGILQARTLEWAAIAFSNA